MQTTQQTNTDIPKFEEATLLDFFAVNALNGLLAARWSEESDREDYATRVAHRAYQIGRAMLAERSQPSPSTDSSDT